MSLCERENVFKTLRICQWITTDNKNINVNNIRLLFF